MWGQCSEKLKDKLETAPNHVVVLAAKDVIQLDEMIWLQAHEMMDTREKKAWTAIKTKANLINHHQEQSKLNDMDYYCKFVGQAQALKNARVTVGQDLCVVEEILVSDGKTLGMATRAERELAVSKAEEPAIVVLYLQNINQTWHGSMVRYLEGAYATRNDIYPTSLPNAY